MESTDPVKKEEEKKVTEKTEETTKTYNDKPTEEIVPKKHETL